MFKTVKEDFSGSTKWFMLMILGGYIPMIIIGQSKDAKLGFTAFAIYFVFIFILAGISFVNVFRKASSVIVIRANITNSPKTEELDINLLVEYFIDLDLSVIPDVEKYDDFSKYEEQIVDAISESANKRLQILETKTKIQDKFDKEHNITTDLAKNTMQKWIEDEFKPINTVDDIIKKKQIFVSLVKLLDSISFEATPDIKCGKCIIITRRPFLVEFETQTRDEILDGYFIKCKSTRAELIRWKSINKDIPVFYSNYTPVDNIKPIQNVLESNAIPYIDNRIMRLMISAQRLEFQDYFAIREEYEQKLIEKDNIIDKYKGLVMVLNLKPISMQLNTISKPKTNIWIYIFGGLVFILSVILAGVL